MHMSSFVESDSKRMDGIITVAARYYGFELVASSMYGLMWFFFNIIAGVSFFSMEYSPKSFCL